MGEERFSTQAGAKAAGWTTYFSGKPCTKGHLGFRRTKSNYCLDCEKDSQRRRLGQVPRTRSEAPPPAQPVISREEALTQGLTRYFTGEPCIHAHLDFRMTSTTTCVACKRDREDAYKRPESERATPGPNHDEWEMAPVPIPPWKPPVTGSASGFIPPMPLARLMAAR